MQSFSENEQFSLNNLEYKELSRTVYVIRQILLNLSRRNKNEKSQDTVSMKS